PFDNGLVPQDRGRDMRNCAIEDGRLECKPATYPEKPRSPMHPVLPPIGSIPKKPFPGLPDDSNPDPGEDPNPDPGNSNPDPGGDTNPDPGNSDPGPGEDPDPGTEPPISSRTLVLYDSTGPYGWLGELYAILAGNLASHFGNWSAKPIVEYESGD